MIGFTVWLAASIAVGWVFGILGPHPDPARCALVLGVWLAVSGGVQVWRDARRAGR